MTRKAEVLVPDYISKNRLQDALENVGGAVVSITDRRRHQPIQERDIPHIKLSIFLQNHGVDISTEYQLNEIFEKLGKLPITRQGKLLIEYYTQAVEEFAEGKEFAEGLVKISNINFFKPREDQSYDEARMLAKEHLDRMNLDTEIPVRFIEGNSIEASKVGLHRFSGFNLQSTTQNINQLNELQIPRIAEAAASKSVAQFEETGLASILDYAVKDLAAYAIWPIIENHMIELGLTKGNPFQPTKTMCEQYGYLPIGPTKIGDSDEYAIFIPPAQIAH